MECEFLTFQLMLKYNDPDKTNYWIRIYFSCAVKSEGILNFSDPAKSTILRDEVLPSL